MNKPAADSLFIKLWLDKHSTINHYFAYVVNWYLRFSIAATS
jgi:hypothetical protein